MISVLRFASVLVLASIAVSLTACKPENKEDTGTASTAAPVVACDDALSQGAVGDDPPIVPGITCLETAKKQISYMIGHDMAKSLLVIKDELDLEVLTQAIADHFAGKEPKLTEEQALKVQESFTATMQAKQAEQKDAEQSRDSVVNAENEAKLAEWRQQQDRRQSEERERLGWTLKAGAVICGQEMQMLNNILTRSMAMGESCFRAATEERVRIIREGQSTAYGNAVLVSFENGDTGYVNGYSLN